MLSVLRKIIPAPIFRAGQPIYHYFLAFLGALLFAFPSRRIKIVGVTGTKGKTTTTELVNAILEEAGHKTALASTLRFKIGAESHPNLHKMTMPGRFFMQKFLSKAHRARCNWVVLEMTSEGAKQFRHKFIDLDALVFTNISPEHIESHGSFEKYLKAKLSLAKSLEQSRKKGKIIVANKDDVHGKDFLSLDIENEYPFSLEQVKPYRAHDNGVEFSFEGELISSKLKGLFNIENMLAAATFASAVGIGPRVIKLALEKMDSIRGRVEFVRINSSKQNFDVVVDYAHTPDSLEKLYQTFSQTPRRGSGSIPQKKLICVLGNTGGGRDRWKRPEMGKIADHYCSDIILTNEDPYDEDPHLILEEMKRGITKKHCEIIIDRRAAIAAALKKAAAGDVVLITGKGTDPYIMGPNGSKQKWDDAMVVREELERVLNSF